MTAVEWLEKELDDENIILVSTHLTGSASVNIKKNEKRITFGFAADAFKRKGDMGHIAFGETPMVSFSVCRKKDCSDETLAIVDKQQDTKKG